MTDTLNAEIDAIVREIEPALIAIRRHLHANPELSLEEFKTAELVEQELASLGIETPSASVGRASPPSWEAATGRLSESAATWTPSLFRKNPARPTPPLNRAFHMPAVTMRIQPWFSALRA